MRVVSDLYLSRLIIPFNLKYSIVIFIAYNATVWIQGSHLRGVVCIHARGSDLIR